MSKTEEYKYLIRRFYAKTASDSDMERIRALMDDEEFLGAWEEVWSEVTTYAHAASTKDKESLFKRIVQDERIVRAHMEQPAFTTRIKPLWKYIGIAASLLLCVSISFFIFNNTQEERGIATLETEVQEVLPGRERAQIVLNDGSAIDLEMLSGDTVLQMDGFSIHKSLDGTISYVLDKKTKEENRIVYNSIVTPKGGEYAIVLPDGSKVWLNASTTLRYPIAFADKERVVQVDGEAYFDVTKQEINGKRVPFVVETGLQRLEVLGTAFNINTYGKEVVTTLVEGKVKLSFGSGDIADKFLEPNDQVSFDSKKNSYTYTKVDPLYIISWKNGNFAFNNADIDEVMKAISRWYDVEIVYKHAFKVARFSGSISRYENIDKMLELIALAGEIHFKREGRRVYVLN